MIDYKIVYRTKGKEIIKVIKKNTNRLSCYPLHINLTGQNCYTRALSRQIAT